MIKCYINHVITYQSKFVKKIFLTQFLEFRAICGKIEFRKGFLFLHINLTTAIGLLLTCFMIKKWWGRVQSLFFQIENNRNKYARMYLFIKMLYKARPSFAIIIKCYINHVVTYYSKFMEKIFLTQFLEFRTVCEKKIEVPQGMVLSLHVTLI